MINHFIGESFSYNDIETTDDPNVLYRLNVKDQYLISAVSIADDDIKLIITNQEGHPVNINGDLLPYEEPYVATTVSGYITNRDDVIRSQMLKIADDLLYNITEEESKMPDEKYLDIGELKNLFPFKDGSSDPNDCLDTLEELGYHDVHIIEDEVHFKDASDTDYMFYIDRVSQNRFQYLWQDDADPSVVVNHTGVIYPGDEEYDDYNREDHIDDAEDPMRAYWRSYYDRRYNEPETEDDIEDEIPSPSLPYDADDEEYEDADELLMEVSKDSTVTVGLYGDDTGDYISLTDLIDKLQKAGLSVTDVSGDEDYGWEMNVSGPAKVIYNMIDDKVPGYSTDSVQDFVDQYCIEEGTSKKVDEATIKGRARKRDIIDALKYNESEDIIVIKDQNGNYYDIEDILPDTDNGYGILIIDTSLSEDTIKKSNGKWTNKGKHGEHGEFSTKKAADAQRKAMFANGYKG